MNERLRAAREQHKDEHVHYKCSCGVTVLNCRCSGPNKKVVIVENSCQNCERTLTAAEHIALKPITKS